MAHHRPALTLDKSATYQIVLQGNLDDTLFDYIGMTVLTKQDENLNPITVLSGQVKDQAMLMGILTDMYNLHRLPLLSVWYISSDESLEART